MSGKIKFWILKLLFLFLGIFVIFILGWIYLYYPAATIHIEPKIRRAVQEIGVYGSLEHNNIQQKDRILPLIDSQIEVIDEQEVDVTGSKKVGQSAATGQATIINYRQEERNLPAGTLLKTDNNIKFKTREEVTIPAASTEQIMDIKTETRAGQKNVDIIAVKKGKQGNIEQGALKHFVEDYGDLQVVNPDSLEGGQDRKKSVVTKQDIKKLKKKLQQEIKNGLKEKIYSEFSGNYRVIEDNNRDYNIKYDIESRLQEEVDTLKGTALLERRVFLVHINQMNRLARSIFSQNLDHDYQLLHEGLNISQINLEQKEQDMYNIKVEVSAPVLPIVDDSGLTTQLAGKKVEEARKFLAEQEDIADFEISGVERIMPFLPYIMKVNLQEPDSEHVFNLDQDN
ncbi:MAG: baseplate J/gp47 family protein [Bacillota bacterium]